MIDVSTLSKLRRLVQRDKMSVRGAARRLGLSRTTAGKWLAMPDRIEPRYPRRAARPGKIDGFGEQLRLWLKADLYRSKRDRRDVKAMFEAIRAMGYSGSLSSVHRFCRKWRDEQANEPRGAGDRRVAHDKALENFRLNSIAIQGGIAY